MAQTPFQYNGQQYTTDEFGSIRDASGQVVANPPLQLSTAGAEAAAGTAGIAPPGGITPVDPNTAGLPATPPRATITTAPPSNIMDPATDIPPTAAGGPTPAPPTGAVPAPAAPGALPPRPPRGQVGSAVEERKQLKDIQDQIQKLQGQADPQTGLTNSQNSLLASLNTRASALSTTIDRIETPPPARSAAGASAPNDAYIVGGFNPDGTLILARNPNHTGQIVPQVVSHGNHTFVITPPTADELAADPSAPPHTTIAYTDKDAQQLAQGQLEVQQSSARTSAAAAATNDFAARYKAMLDDRVSKGEDAASVRADLDQQLAAKHQTWVESNGDAQRAQTKLDSYNAQRHQTALETQGQQTIDNTAAAQARQDATAQRGQDISAQTSRYQTDTAAQTSKYATDAATHTAKLAAAGTMFSNALTMLGNINKDLPPGSALAGQALEGLLAYGTKFLNGFAGDQNGKAPPVGPDGKPLPDPSQQVDPGVAIRAAVKGAGDADWQRADQAATSPVGDTGLAAPGAAGTVPAGSPTYMGNGVPPGPSGGLDYLFNNPSSPVANPTNTPPTAPPPPQPMAAPQPVAPASSAVPLSPDGSPVATAADVERIFNRQITAVGQGSTSGAVGAPR